MPAHNNNQKSAEEWLYEGLKPNALPPRNKEELLSELERLNKYFQQNNIESVEKEFVKEYEKWQMRPDVSLTDLLGYLFLGWLVICISSLFDSVIGYALGIGFIFYGFYKLKLSRKTIDDIAPEKRKQYQKIYRSAVNNFMLPAHVRFTGVAIDAIKNKGCSTYEEVLKEIKSLQDLISLYKLNELLEKREKEKKQSQNTNTPTHPSLRPESWAGLYGRCPYCGHYINPLGLCSNCGRKIK